MLPNICHCGVHIRAEGKKQDKESVSIETSALIAMEDTVRFSGLPQSSDVLSREICMSNFDFHTSKPRISK